MNGCIFYYPGGTPATDHAVSILQAEGCRFAAAPGPEVTDLLLSVPLFHTDTLPELLCQLPTGLRIFGGRLPPLKDHRVHDLLQDPLYTAQNACITAHCAVRYALERLPVILQDCTVLVIGWGRIGKCLANLLRAMGAQVTVAARKEADRAMLSALGYRTCTTAPLQAEGYRVIFNTAPAPVPCEITKDCLAIDLASVPGLTGEHILHAPGLPGKLAPHSSGELIAQSILQILKKEASQ